MHSPTFYGSVTFHIVIYRKANSEDYDKIEDKYVVLCTNMPVDKISVLHGRASHDVQAEVFR